MTALHINLPSASSAAVRIEVRFDSPQPEVLADGMDWITGRFLRLANADGFSGNRAAGRCELVARTSDRLGYVVDLAAEDLDARCFLVIFFGIYSMALGHDAALSGISLRSAGSTFEVDLARFLAEESAPYPGTSSEVGRYVTRDVSFANRREIVFDLFGSPPPEVEDIFEVWCDVARLSFPRDLAGFEAGREFLINAALHMPDEASLAVVIDDFECHDSAVDPLIEAVGRILLRANALRAIHVQ
jgi:hypothetical protein